MSAPTWDAVLRKQGISIHPAATLFPLGPEEGPNSLASLSSSIERGHLINMLRLWRQTESDPWALIDGRRRCAAMSRLVDGESRIESAISLAERHTGGNPLDLIEGLNNERRHSTLEERRKIADALLSMDPSRSNLQISKQSGLSDKTVDAIREAKAARSEIPNVATRTDTKGRQQPAAKPAAKPKAEVWAGQADKVLAQPAPKPQSVQPVGESKPERAKREFREWVGLSNTMALGPWIETGENLVKAYKRIPELKNNFDKVARSLRDLGIHYREITRHNIDADPYRRGTPEELLAWRASLGIGR